MIGETFFRFRAKLRWKKRRVLLCSANAWIVTCELSGDSEAMLFFKFYSLSLQHIWRTYRANIHDQLIEIATIVSVDVILSISAKWQKSLGTWMSVFGGHFSALFQCVMTESWNQPQPGCWNYLYYIFIHSCKYTQHFKTVFNSVSFSTEVHNPLACAPFGTKSHIYL